MVQEQPTPRTTQRSVETLSFEEAMRELEGIVRRLEQGSLMLEESIAAYRRGDALRLHCKTLLERAQGEVEKITRDAQQDDKSQNKSEKDKSKKNDTRQADQPFSRQKLATL